MDKRELVNLTLNQLHEKFNSDPECFRLEGPPYTTNLNFHEPAILWQFKVELNGEVIPDPNCAPRTIIVIYNKHLQQLSCYIFMREVNSLSSAIMSDGVVNLEIDWPMFSTQLWSFKSLVKKLNKHTKEKAHMEYVRKLTSIFPGTFEDDILK